MNRPRLCRGALLLLATTGAFIGSACGPERTFFIRACLVEPPDSCQVAADPAAPTLSQGVFDPSFENDYACPLLAGNTSEPPIEITEADIRLLREDGTALANGDGAARIFSAPTSGFVDTGTVGVPGLGITRLRMLDVATANAVLAASGAGAVVIAAVVLHGKTLDGEEVATEEWRFPIRVVPHQGLCDLGPCIPGQQIGGYPQTNCHPGINDPTDCRQGCKCAAGECGPLACVASGSASKGICVPCRVGEADCGGDAECVPYPSSGDEEGLCL